MIVRGGFRVPDATDWDVGIRFSGPLFSCEKRAWAASPGKMWYNVAALSLTPSRYACTIPHGHETLERPPPQSGAVGPGRIRCRRGSVRASGRAVTPMRDGAGRRVGGRTAAHKPTDRDRVFGRYWSPSMPPRRVPAMADELC
jgi:hypothetical protein